MKVQHYFDESTTIASIDHVLYFNPALNMNTSSERSTRRHTYIDQQALLHRLTRSPCRLAEDMASEGHPDRARQLTTRAERHSYRAENGIVDFLELDQVREGDCCIAIVGRGHGILVC